MPLMLLSTQNLTLTYQDGKNIVYAVKDINIELPEKGLFGILGPSGSGKTSLLYLLSGIKKQTQGDIVFKNNKFPASTSKRNYIRRNEMGFVFQFHFLINYLTVKENILVGAHSDTDIEEYCIELMDKLGLKDFANRFPYELSGGQRQRVAIARALANKPKIVFVDEPTASLDHEAGAKVMNILDELSKEACIIVVTHDESILKNAENIFVMRDGILERSKI